MQRQLVSKALESERIEVPLAIQTYLWGQTSFFLKPNLHEKKSYGHVCVAFEKIICENRVGDLPPNLSRSMNTIPRWHFVQGALPFVLHCCAALLSNRAVHGNTEERLTVAETKLLYTLHWILLKAPDEVEHYSGKLYPLNIVELFIQSVVPYIKCIQPQDLSFRLQEGLELWEALWEFRTPPLKCFTASVVFEKQDGDKISLAGNSTRNGSASDLQVTFFDVAVLKCLMLPDWHDEGRAWALQYVLKYLDTEEKLLLEQSNRNSSSSCAEVEAESPVSEKVPKPVQIQATVASVSKLKRFYGLSASPDESSSGGQKRRSVKDSNRIRHVSSSSSSSLLDALTTLSNLKLSLEVEENKTEVVNGAKEFLDENGTLKKSVFLDVVCQIASQSTNARVCDLVLSILEHILEKHVMKIKVPEKQSTDDTPADKGPTENSTPMSKQNTEGIVGKFSFLLSFKKALVCVIKVVCALGCSYGCGRGIRGVIGKKLRAKTMAMLSKIHDMDKDNFITVLRNYIEDQDVEVVTNFLHALLGFCTMTLESKSTQKKMSDHFKEKSGILGIIIDTIFAPYIARLLEFNLEEISNVTLYGQVRQLTKYVKEYAGGTFFRVVFRGLLKASGKPQKRVLDPLPDVKPSAPTTVTDGDTGNLPKITAMEKIVTPKNQRKNFFSKFSKSTSSADGSPVGNPEFNFDGSTTPLSRRKAIKGLKKGSPIEESFSGEDDFRPTGSIERRRKSLMNKFFKPNRKKADDIFSIELRKSAGVSLTSFRQQRCGVEYTSIPVNVQEIRDGMMMFSMLLESCLPGSVPDPNIVAGILELKAPAVARGALLVECAHFVHRCNKGEWPSWLLSSHPSTRRGKGGFGALVRNAIAVSRRNVRIKHEAGLLFYKWAVAIGEKLEQIESSSVSASESNKETKDVMDNTREVEEDFLDEGTLDEKTKRCPHALKMVACQLLLEITAFLRESHSSLARKAENQRLRNKSIAFSRQNRRTTQKISVFGAEHRDAVTSGPAERLRQGNPSMLSPVMNLLVPTVQIQQGGSEKKISAPVIKVDGGPSENENDEASKPPRKRFSALFSNSEKKRKLLKPETTERKASSTASRIYKKSTKLHKTVGRVTSDASDTSDNEEEEVTKFPWLKAVTMVSGSTNFICEHRDVCAPGCIRRQTQNCAKYMSALKTVYSKPVSQLANNTSRKLEGDKGRQCKLSTKELTIKQKEERDKIMTNYVSEKVRNLFNCPMSVMIKGAVVMEPSLLFDIIPLAWELLLNPLEELVSTAAAVFLIASLHLKEVVEKMLHKELTCNSCEHQVKSLMRYGVLWRSRYHVWPRMEAGAKYVLRIPLPKLDFTLPSPPVGSSAPPVPDCPWDPKASIHITKNELELTEEDRQKDEEETLKAEREKKKQRTYYNFTNASVSLEASTPAEPEEGSDVVVQPTTTDFWPPAMSSAIPRIIGLLDDSSLTLSQTSVSEMAKSTLWECLVDDPMLFFRTFFEEITKPNKQKELVFLLNKLLVHIPKLPPNAGVIFFNHLVGVVLFYSRRSQPCSEDAIALILSSLLWKIVPSVPKLYLKDLKYSAKKEHCERTLMVTANTPGTKKIIVTKPDATAENEKLTVREDMTFDHILQYCTAKWSLDNPYYRLLDAKSGQILEGKHLVRDIYAFKKGFPYPQLKLQVYKQLDAYVKRQEQAFIFKMAEVGRLYLTLGILETVQNWHHVSFLHSELSKQIAFPRKALDVDFGLYEGGLKGRQLCSMDGIHKRMWIKLLSKLFDSMTSSFPWGDDDLHLFLNVINGALLLQCEDSSMLRFCLSTLINAAIKFTDIFAIDGYHHILPTLALLYSHHENNEIVCNAVEFVISQFYVLHQKPFLLQLFASIEPMLLTENVNKMPEHSDEMDESNMILPKCLFAILSSLEKDVPDSLDILALVEANKPLKPLDSCYEGKLEDNECKIDIAVRLCVTVVAFSPESIRATQMLVILSSILPFYLEYVKNNDGLAEKKKEYKDELATLQSLHCSVQVLLKSCNSLRRPFLKMKGLSSAAKRRVREGSTGSVTSFTTSHENVRQSRAYTDDDDRDLDSLDQQFKPFLSKFSTQDEGEQVLDSLYEFRTPRNAILVIVSEFISKSKKRLYEINEKNANVQVPNLTLDHESIQALCNIAHTLLKLSLTDTVSLELTGLQKFMLEALPNIDWSAEEILPALNLILKRINTTFTKITDKPDLMNFFWPYPLLLHRSENWNVTDVLLKGLYLTISKQAIVTTLPCTKAVVATCMHLVLREQVDESEPECGFNYYPPPSLNFCQIVVKLAARLMFSLKDKYSLKDLCGGTLEFGNADRTLRVLVHILLPLCIRLGTGSKGQPRASKEDVSYAVSCFLNIIVTPFADMSLSARRLSSSILVNDATSPSSPFVKRALPRRGDAGTFSPSIYNAAYLGLKIAIICFPSFLSSEWRTMASVLKEVVLHGAGNEPLFEFLEFIILHRSPLFLLLLPIIRSKITDLTPTSSRASTLKEDLLRRLHKPTDPTPSKQEWMQRFIQDLGVLTSGEQNDMFFCRNPSIPNAQPDFNSVMDVESLSGSEAAHIPQTRDAQTGEAQTRESLELPERDRKLSSSRKENIDKLRRSLKKKVSFDKGQSYNLLEEAKGEANPEGHSAPRQKRSLPRQEIAIDLESPVSNKRLSDNYPVIARVSLSGVDGQCGQNQEKKRKIVKDKKFTRQNTGLDSSQSTEMSSFSGLSQEGADNDNETAFNTKGNVGKTLTVPNLVVKASITERSDSGVCGTNNELVPSKANSEKYGLLQPRHEVNKNISGKRNSDPLDGQDAIPDNPFTNCEVVVEDKSSKSLSVTTFSQDLQNSSDTSPLRDSPGVRLPPADENENKNLSSRESMAKTDDSNRWSCSVLDRSKETSL